MPSTTGEHQHQPPPRGLPRVLALITASATALAVAACGAKDHDTSEPTTTTSGPTTRASTHATTAPASTAVSPTGATNGALYSPPPGNPCDIADLHALEQRFGARGRPVQSRTASHSISTLSCATRFGNGGTIIITMNILDRDGSTMYEGLRRVRNSASPVTTITGLGAAAYSYIEPTIGPYVDTYDGNLYISAGWSSRNTTTATPQEIITLLVRVCQDTIKKLRT